MISTTSGLKALVIKGSAWTLAGNLSGQLIRLGKSLIVTRLLFPEAFGVMSLVWVVLFGLEMFSDVGIGSVIVQDKDGDKPDFLDTCWTVQVIRGMVLFLIACLLAHPMAVFYNEPLLGQLIPVAGLTAVIAGFNSTKLHTCRRYMQIGRLTVLDFG